MEYMAFKSTQNRTFFRLTREVSLQAEALCPALSAQNPLCTVAVYALLTCLP